MTRSAGRLGEEYRAALGATPPGVDDERFAAALARTAARGANRLAIGAGLFALAAAIAVLAFVRGRAIEREPSVEIAEPATLAAGPRGDALDAVSTEEDAAFLLAAARVRLDGYGDPDAGRERLRRVVRDYPATAAARAAAVLLSKGDGK
jgi:hypothetical protein